MKGKIVESSEICTLGLCHCYLSNQRARTVGIHEGVLYLAR